MSHLEPLIRALLYEGYILYPYRPTALKNRHRWTFGGLLPPAYVEANDGDSSFLQSECLVETDAGASIEVRVQFLHPLLCIVPNELPRQEATERRVDLSDLSLRALAESTRRIEFAFPEVSEVDATGERTQRAIEGFVEVSVTRLERGLVRVTVRVHNVTPCEGADEMTRDEAVLRSLASAHVILGVRGGSFVSLLEPHEDLRAEAEACRNMGVWPVLVGEPGRRDAMLASPIVLYDYPRVAPESDGDFFDGTEIDEMLALRILTLGDDEKLAMRTGDARARNLLERVESMNGERMGRLHGAVCSDTLLGPGDRVRLRPRGRADAFDILLAGKTATIVGTECDFEGTAYYTLTVDDDPGRDLGATGQPGHRFFFRTDEVESLVEEPQP